MNKVYFPNLNGLRFFAAFSVMLYHFFGKDIINGHYGVVLFFVLSGFLITYLLFEEKDKLGVIEIKKFYFRRILRIWPLYYFVFLLASILFYISNEPASSYLQSLPYYLFFLPNVAFVLDLSINYAIVLWSVGSEEQFYLVWPHLIKQFSPKLLKYIFLIILFSWAIGPHVIDYVNVHFLDNSKGVFVFTKLLGRVGFGAMATGALLAYYLKYEEGKLGLINNMIVQIASLGIVVLVWGLDLLPHTAISDAIYAFLFALIISNFAINPKVIINLENKLLNFLGKVSFGLYVYHLFSFHMVRNLNHHYELHIPKIILFVIGVFITIVFAYFSYEYFEKPFLKLKLRKFTTIKSGNEIYENKN
jgi:peptidoglycan/LPS O-acetylase OafA/YrhL